MALPDVKNRTLGDKYQLVNIFLVDAFIIITGLKMKNCLIQQEKVIKKNLTYYH